MSNHARVIVLSGPGGVGKTTIISELLKKFPGTLTAVTKLTSRQPRTGETPGQEFNFVSAQEFRRAIASGELLEHNFFNGHYYGVPRQPLDAALATGKNPLLNIDVNGARAVRQHYPGRSLLIFVTAPADQLRQRYLRRGHSPEEADQRLKIAQQDEFPAIDRYDAVVQNNEGALDETVTAIAKLVQTQ